METVQSAREFNANFAAAVSDPRTIKSAADTGANYIRWRQREMGFMRKFLPPTDVVDSDIQINEFTDKPRVVREMEPDAPGAMTIGYGGLPADFFISSRRFVISPTMMMSPRASIYLQHLRTFRYDVRKVWADNMVRDTLADEDQNFVSSINAMLLGVNTAMFNPTGVAQWRSYSGGVSRNNVVEGMTILPVAVPNALPVESVLTSIGTMYDVLKWGRDEVGGDLAEQQLVNGWVEQKLVNARWYGTIKTYLVPRSTAYYFAPTKCIGESLMFEPMKMHIEQKINRYTFFVHYEIGTAIANTASIARADFTP